MWSQGGLPFLSKKGEEYKMNSCMRKQVKKAVAELERELFMGGYYGAFGMSCGPCNLCEECEMTKPCAHPRLARPSMEACGIDVFATLRNVGLNIDVVTSRQESCTFCGLIPFELR